MKTIILFLHIVSVTYAQWQLGVSYKIKNETPRNGIGISIGRNLPYQGASFGIHLDAEINIFRETASVNFTGTKESYKFLSEDYNLRLTGTYFLKYFSPYLGFSAGYGELSSKKHKWQGLILSVLAGNRFNINNIVKPYFEIQLIKYFAGFDSRLWGISMSDYQFRGAIGINISINTLRNN